MDRKKSKVSFEISSDLRIRRSLRDFFLSLQRIVRIRLSAKYGMLGLSSLAFSWFSLFALDRLGETPASVRGLVLVLGVSGALWTGSKLYSIIFRLSPDSSWLARQVRKLYRGKGERMLGIIEIAGEREAKEPSFSPRIFEAAQERMEKELHSVDCEKIFPLGMLRWPLISMLALIFLCVSLIWAYPGLSLNAWERWSQPWDSVKRRTLTLFSLPPENRFYLLEGESSVLRFPLSGESGFAPKFAELECEGDQPFMLQTKSNGGVYEFSIPPLSKSCKVTLKGGDFRGTIALTTVKRPRILSLSATLDYPNYLGIPSETLDLRNGKIRAPQGTALSLNGLSDRVLSQVSTGGNGVSISGTVKGRTFEFFLPAPFDSRTLTFRCLDKYGFSPLSNRLVYLQTREDDPSTSWFEPQVDSSPVLIFETRSLPFISRDDYGLSQQSLEIQILRNEQVVHEQTLIAKRFDPYDLKDHSMTFPFDPQFLSLEDGDEAVFTVTSKDRFPEREITRSKPLRLSILGPARHADSIRSQMEVMMAEVAEIARNQESTQFETLEKKQQLDRSDSPELDENQKRMIKKLSSDQEKLSGELGETVKRGLSIMEEASRNPLIQTSTLEDFGQTVQAMSNTSSKTMLSSKAQLQTASNSDQKQASRKLLNSAQLQQQALDELQAILSNFSKQVDQLQAMTLAQRLKQSEEGERKLSHQLLTRMPDSIGKTRAQLSLKNLGAIQIIEDMQNQISVEAGEIGREITRYFERTGKPEYGKVSRLMEKAKVEKSLAELAEEMNRNIFFQSLAHLNQWEKNFSHWAEILMEEFPGQESQPGKSEGKDWTAEIMSLLKIRQTQTEILQKTRIADQGSFQAKRDKWTETLKLQQDTLMIDLTDTQISLAEESFNPLLDDAHTAMFESSEFLSMEIVDSRAQSSQIEAKDFLSDLINLMIEGQGQGSDKENLDELSAMEFLMQQMAANQKSNAKGKSLTPGKTGGGSAQGGETDQTSEATDGKTSGSSSQSRSTQSDAGGMPSIAPEFQEVMEKYFEEIDQ